MPVITCAIKILLVFSFYNVSGISLKFKTDPSILQDAKLNTCSLILKYGYPCEVHHTITRDGYVLEMHRIPHGKHSASKDARPVIFLQHGLLSSSAEWVLMSPGKGFAYLLADAGYDVWMGNARGNTYSRHHISLSANSTEFWQFSWHEIGFYDMPAMIDYTIKNTSIPKIQYAAFSQGTTVFWVMTSTRPEYNDKIIAMHALAPIAYVGNMRSPLVKTIAPLTGSIHAITKLIGPDELLPNGKINELAGQKLCLEEAITQALCKNLLFLICGFDNDQLNTTMLPVVLGHTPAGASTKQFIHFGQLYNSKQFTNFDYGWIKNKYMYGTFSPPAYNLSSIRTPIYLHYASNDWLSTTTDVEKLSLEVKSIVGKFQVPLPKFNHLDFVFGNEAKKYLYDRIINTMSTFL